MSRENSATVKDIVAASTTQRHARCGILDVFVCQETQSWPCGDMICKKLPNRWVSHWLNRVASSSRDVRSPQKLDGRPMYRGLGKRHLDCECVWPRDVGHCEIFMHLAKKIWTELRNSTSPATSTFRWGFDDVAEKGASLHGRHVWTGGCADLHHCLKRASWVDMLEHVDCCAAFTWLSCDHQVAEANTHLAWDEEEGVDERTGLTLPIYEQKDRGGRLGM